ncbi:hypothetical protein [uncultured Desulfovibrio sp.]|uniref:hypothetical protein n=1 Tax=uncultured Desulfovibrio sp. TaxID=167968 RepID=UPI0026072B53|nr:hypothetical protein [uncultured Desulfovibrio sp.]
MKLNKTSLLALALAASISLAACGALASEESTDTPAPTATPEASTPEDSSESTGDMGVAEVAEPDSELSALVDSIYEAYPVELMMMQTTAIDLDDESWLTYNTGLTAEQAELVDAGVKSESLTGSQAYSLVLLRVKDAADAQTVADAMLENIDPAKWVCVMADQQRVVTFDDKVLFVMASSELTDVNALIDALPEALGIEYTYDKTAEVEAGDAVAPDMDAPVVAG